MREVNVVFDSCVLWPREDAIVTTDFEDFLKKFSDKYNLKIYIPEVVRGELCYRKVSKADEKLESAKQSLSSIGRILERQRKPPYKTEELRPLVEKRFDKWSKKWNVILLETPYDKISLKELEEKSIWRIPPFEDVKKNLVPCKNCRKEKGFRDALILFSVLELVKKIKTNKVYFICNDNVFLEAIDNYTENKRLVPLKTIKELSSRLSSRLRLSLQRDNEKWINSISEKASEVFFKRAWKELNIYEEIEKKRYPEHFEIPSRPESGYLSYGGQHIQTPNIIPSEAGSIYSPILQGSQNIYGLTHELGQSQNIYGLTHELGQTRYVPLNRGRYLIENPIFQKVENNNIYIWKSGVSHEREYRELWETSLLVPKIYKIYFDVTWSAKVTKDERFCNLKLLDIEFLNKGFDFSLSPY